MIGERHHFIQKFLLAHKHIESCIDIFLKDQIVTKKKKKTLRNLVTCEEDSLFVNFLFLMFLTSFWIFTSFFSNLKMYVSRTQWIKNVDNNGIKCPSMTPRYRASYNPLSFQILNLNIDNIMTNIKRKGETMTTNTIKQVINNNRKSK